MFACVFQVSECEYQDLLITKDYTALSACCSIMNNVLEITLNLQR